MVMLLSLQRHENNHSTLNKFADHLPPALGVTRGVSQLEAVWWMELHALKLASQPESSRDVPFVLQMDIGISGAVHDFPLGWDECVGSGLGRGMKPNHAVFVVHTITPDVPTAALPAARDNLIDFLVDNVSQSKRYFATYTVDPGR